MAYKEKYLMDVMESLFKLLSFFFHVFRPLVCLVLEHGASLSHDDFILNAKLQSEHKKLLKRDEENWAKFSSFLFIEIFIQKQKFKNLNIYTLKYVHEITQKHIQYNTYKQKSQVKCDLNKSATTFLFSLH